MTTLRTSANLTKYDARRLVSGGYEIAYVETRHLDTGDVTSIVWTRPVRIGDVLESEIPY